MSRRRDTFKPIYHLRTSEENDRVLTDGVIKQIMKTGQVNLSGKGLSAVPEKMFTMYDLEKKKLDVDFYNWNECYKDEERWWNFEPLKYIDMSSNTLAQIPARLRMFEELTTLNLQDNCLTDLPPEIGHLTKLIKLNLARNKIKVLPDEFYKLTELVHLSLAHNCLQSLSESIGDLIMLSFLDLSYNELTILPLGLGYLVRLGDLNVSYNKLTELPSDFTGLRALEKLDITHNNIAEIKYLHTCRKLRLIFAQHNNIEYLPSLLDCENIREIYLGNNYIKEVSKEFCEYTSQLKILDLRDNKIDDLPAEIAMMQHLIRLDLTNNDLHSLPNSLGLLSHLQNFQLEGNKIKQIRSDILKGGTIRLLKYLREKYDCEIENDKLAEFGTNLLLTSSPKFPDIYSMRHSKSLLLSAQELTSIPNSVFEDAKKAEITIVDLSKNKFIDVPSGMSIITPSLIEINLSFNQLTSLSNLVCDCVKLVYLDLATNRLVDLPASMIALKVLRELVLSHNKFEKVPDCIYDIPALEILQLNDNKIDHIDVVNSLDKLKRLTVLNLANNNIHNIPPELGHMKQLRSLELRGNSFKTPRYAILEQGTDALLAYLRDRIPRQ